MIVPDGGPVRRIRQLLGGRRLIVVSNREPYVRGRDAGDRPQVSRPAGGLVASLDPIMRAVSGTWIAWGSGEGDFDVTDRRGRVAVPPGAPRYTLRRLALSRAEVDGYYYGYANQGLWPLFHMATDKARFHRRFWVQYLGVNRRFAAAVLEEAGDDPLIWIHDYHFMLCPRLLRDARPELFLMHFWHIPWPSWDVWQRCPQGAELLEGLLANDLIGFQRPRHVNAFLKCAARGLGARIDQASGAVEHAGHTTHVRAFPISVDAAALDETARSEDAVRWMARLRRRFGLDGRALAIGVDRLDYTKGIPHRLRAFDLLLRQHPEYRGRLVFIQKSAPSRTRIRAYRELQAQVEREIARINAAHGTAGWRPVVHLSQPLPLEGMAALYRIADVCVVSSLQDGMNLVAKEFVACQVDRRGVLVLSELAGAQRELPWALSINPHDTAGFAQALCAALAMPAAERWDRMTQMRAYLSGHDIYRWMAGQFEEATGLLSSRRSVPPLLDHTGEIRRSLGAGRVLALLLDFDGTIVPIAGDPGRVRLPGATTAVLSEIAAIPNSLVAILSGRSLDDVRDRVGLKGIVYAGNHGLEIAGDAWRWTYAEVQPATAAIKACCRWLRRRLRRIPGVLIEEKGLSASVHFRRTPVRFVGEVRAAVHQEAGRVPPGVVEVLGGTQVLEIRPRVPWDKGAAARWILRRTFGEDWPSKVCAIYLGDDRTDEDAFQALDGAVTVKVGPPAPTAARYGLRDPGQVVEFLRLLARWAAPAVSGAESPQAPDARPDRA